MKNKFIISLLFILTLLNGFGQYTGQIEGLKKELSAAGLHDTNKVIIMIKLADLIKGSSNDSSAMYSSMAYELSKKINYKHGLQWALNAMAIIKIRRHVHDTAILYLEEALKISKVIGAPIGEANILNNLGQLYFDKGNYPKSLDYYFKALKLAQELKDETQEAMINSNIGQVHFYSLDYSKAERYFLNAMELHQKLLDTAGIGLDEGNLGNLYYRLGEELKSEGKTDSAGKLFERSLRSLFQGMEISIKYNKRSLITGAMGNIGNVYYGMGRSEEAVDYYKKALKIDLEMKNFNGAMNHFNNIGWVLYETKNYKESEVYTKRAIVIADSLKSIRLLFNLYENLSILYEETGEYELALDNYKKFVAAKDSVFNLENAKKTVMTEMNFEMEKKEAVIAEAANRQRMIRNSFIAGFAFMLLLAVLIYRGFRQKRKANIVIMEQKAEMERQKELVELKNKEITDSIHYAQRIQSSLMPSEKFITKILLCTTKDK